MMRAKHPAPTPQLHQWFRVLMATILVCAALSVGSVVGVMARTFNPPKILRTMIDPVTGEERTVEVAQGGALNPWDIVRPFNNLDRKINILVLGSDYNYARGKRVTDEQAGVRSRTDTIMLVSLDPATQKVGMLSIPRDTRALLSGYHYDKINAAMVYGGVDLVKSTVSDLTGVPIDYYMALKVDGLINMVDILGGLRIYVEKDMYYMDETAHLGINIHKGWKERMSGEQAHHYIRFRKDELGDIGRVQRQQKFIKAVIDKLMQPASWLKIPDLLNHLNQNIDTDIPSEVVGQMVRFGTQLQKDDIRMVMMPGTFATIGGVSYWEVNPYTARNVITDMFPDSSLAVDLTQDPGTPSDNPLARYRVSVWNASGDLRTGREVIRRLREAGWVVWSVAKAPHDTPVTRVIAQTGKAELLPQLQQAIGFTGESVTASIGDIATDFTVLIGPDLVKHYQSTLTEDDWNRAQQQPDPSTPAYRAPVRQRSSRSSAAQTTPASAPVRRPSNALLQTPSEVRTEVPAQAPMAVSTPINVAPQVELAPQLPDSARQAAPAAAPDDVEINAGDY